jgi:hypothetical protein
MEGCVPGYRYRFYRDDKKYFDATFVQIIRTTLTVSNYSDEDGVCNGLLRSMPKSCVERVERLYDNIWAFLCI